VLLDRLLADAGILAASVTGPEAASHLEVAMTVACAGDTRRHAGGRIRADRIAHGNAVAQVAVYVRELTSCPSRRGGNVVSIIAQNLMKVRSQPQWALRSDEFSS
jgi:hypothetical protein